MDKAFGYYIFGGMLIGGALFGWIWAAGSNPLVGLGVGAMAGAFIGWFAAAAVFEQRKKLK